MGLPPFLVISLLVSIAWCGTVPTADVGLGLIVRNYGSIVWEKSQTGWTNNNRLIFSARGCQDTIFHINVCRNFRGLYGEKEGTTLLTKENGCATVYKGVNETSGSTVNTPIFTSQAGVFWLSVVVDNPGSCEVELEKVQYDVCPDPSGYGPSCLDVAALSQSLVGTKILPGTTTWWAYPMPETGSFGSLVVTLGFSNPADLRIAATSNGGMNNIFNSADVDASAVNATLFELKFENAQRRSTYLFSITSPDTAQEVEVTQSDVSLQNCNVMRQGYEGANCQWEVPMVILLRDVTEQV